MLLRPYQETFVAECLKALGEKNNTIGVGPTGCGKTVILSALVDRLLPTGGKALILQHRQELLGQNAAKFNAVAAKKRNVSVFDADSKVWSGDVVFSMEPTLRRSNNLETLPRFDVAVIDEAHHASADGYTRIVAKLRELNPDLKLIGMTATPNRGDRKGVSDKFDNVGSQIRLTTLIELGFLVRPRCYAISLGKEIDEALAAVGKVGDEYDMGEVAEIIGSDPVTEKMISHWKEKAADRQTIVFSPTVDHAAMMQAAFQARGITAAMVSAETPKGEREQILANFDKGLIQVVTNCMVLTEGYDCLSSDTEVLTPSGWKLKDHFSVGDPVMAFDMETGAIINVNILDIGERPVRDGERMIEWESQHVSMRVTEGHRMVSRGPRKATEWSIAKAGAIYDAGTEYEIPLAAGSWNGGSVDLTDAEIKFVAWTYTDSYIDKRGRLTLYQTKVDGIEHIRQILTKCGFTWKERARLQGGFNNSKAINIWFELDDQWKRIAEYCRNSGTHARKETVGLSESLLGISPQQFKIFFNELLIGDGSRQGSKSGWLWTPSEAMADDITRMAVVRGFATSKHNETTPAGLPFWRVTARDQTTFRSYPKDPRATRITVSAAFPGETVWCLTNRLGTLITRRNGKVAVVGNCQPVSCIVLCRPCSQKPTMIQMIGRGLRTVDPDLHPGVLKTECTVLDFGASLKVHGTLDQDVNLKGKREAPTKTCPSCQEEVSVFVQYCPGCGYTFWEKEEETEEPGLKTEKKELRDFSMEEVDLLKRSNFRWSDIYEDETVFVAAGFFAWGAVTKVGEVWHGFGGTKLEGQRRTYKYLGMGTKVIALALADDHINQFESGEGAHKTRGWLRQPISGPQVEWLEKLNDQLAKPFPNVTHGNRYLSSCRMTWGFNVNAVKQLLIRQLRVMKKVGGAKIIPFKKA